PRSVPEKHVPEGYIPCFFPGQFYFVFLFLPFQVHDLKQAVGSDPGILYLLVGFHKLGYRTCKIPDNRIEREQFSGSDLPPYDKVRPAPEQNDGKELRYEGGRSSRENRIQSRLIPYVQKVDKARLGLYI